MNNFIKIAFPLIFVLVTSLIMFCSCARDKDNPMTEFPDINFDQYDDSNPDDNLINYPEEKLKENKEKAEEKGKQNIPQIVDDNSTTNPEILTKEEYARPTNPIILPPQEQGERKLWDSDIKWTMTISKGELLDTLGKMQIRVAYIKPILIDTVDAQGCASILSIGGRLINAYEICERLKLPSSYIKNIEITSDNIIFEGMGTFEPDLNRKSLDEILDSNN